MTWILVALAGLVSLGVAFYQYLGREWGLFALRALGLFSIALLLINPKLGVGGEEPLQVSLLFDNSRSMGEGEKRELAEGLLVELGGRGKLYTFGGELREARKLAFEGEATDMSAVGKVSGDAVVLVTDGMHNSETDPLETLPGAPVFAFLPPAHRTGHNSKVARVDGPSWVVEGEAARLYVTLNTSRGYSASLRVSEGGRTLLDTSLTLSQGNTLFQYVARPKGEGVHRYSFTLSPLQGEKELIDQTRGFALSARKAADRVVIAAGRPSPAVRAVRDGFGALPFTLAVYVRTTSGWMDVTDKPALVALPDMKGALMTVLIDPDISLARAAPTPRIVLLTDPLAASGFGLVSQGVRKGSFTLRPAPGFDLDDSLLRWVNVKQYLSLRLPPAARPVLLAQNGEPVAFELGEDFFFATDELWRFALKSQPLFGALFGRAVGAATKHALTFVVWAGKGEYGRGEPVWVYARAFRPGGGTPEGLSVTLQGKPARTGGGGEFVAGPFRVEPGEYAWRAVLFDEGKRVGGETVRFVVSEEGLERYDRGVDTLLVSQLCSRTGGKLVGSVEELEAALALIPRRKREPFRPLQLPWLVVVPLALFGLEWGIRRFTGRR